MFWHDGQQHPSWRTRMLPLSMRNICVSNVAPSSWTRTIDATCPGMMISHMSQHEQLPFPRQAALRQLPNLSTNGLSHDPPGKQAPHGVSEMHGRIVTGQEPTRPAVSERSAAHANDEALSWRPGSRVSHSGQQSVFGS